MTGTNPEYGIVMSGGGARGLAHIGVLAALEEHGIYPGMISGSSMGAIIGALYAAGLKPDEIMKIARNRKLYNLFNWSVPRRGGMISLKLLEKVLAKSIPVDSFESLEKKLFIAVSNISSGKGEIISEGPLLQVVIASASIPVVFEPKIINGKTYVDGGLFNDLPVEPLEGKCKKIIASHVNYNGPDPELATIRAIAERIYRLAIYQHVHKNFNKCDYIIDPPELREHGFFSFKHIDKLFEIGYKATELLISKMRNPDNEKPLIVRSLNDNPKQNAR
jgi:NTE family protein